MGRTKDSGLSTHNTSNNSSVSANTVDNKIKN